MLSYYIATNVHPTNVPITSRQELLAWVNSKLESEFTKVEEFCSGAAYCQLMDELFPGSISLRKVKFETNLEREYLQNFKLLQGAFEVCSVNKEIPTARLVKGHFQDNYEFAKWFKTFYYANTPKIQPNSINKEYDAKKRRFDQNYRTGEILETESNEKQIEKPKPNPKYAHVKSRLKKITPPPPISKNRSPWWAQYEPMITTNNDNAETEAFPKMNDNSIYKAELKSKIAKMKEEIKVLEDSFDVHCDARDKCFKELSRIEEFLKDQVLEVDSVLPEGEEEYRICLAENYNELFRTNHEFGNYKSSESSEITKGDELYMAYGFTPLNFLFGNDPALRGGEQELL